MTTGRLAAFADGVFAIAATLLILNVDIQVGGEVHDLGARLLEVWPSYVAYAVSFLTIGIIWVNHHAVIPHRSRVQRDLVVASAGKRLLKRDSHPRAVSGITRSYLPGPLIYLVATLAALVSPTASVILFAAIAFFYVAESSIFGRREQGA